MSNSAIDFAFVKAEADFLAVLLHYGLKLQGSGVQRQAHCPFHDDKRPSFKANLGRKVAEICNLPLVPPTGGAVIGQKRPKETHGGPETIKGPSGTHSPSGEAP